MPDERGIIVYVPGGLGPGATPRADTLRRVACYRNLTVSERGSELGAERFAEGR